MIESAALIEEDFLQQFPDNAQYAEDGLEFEDWWDTDADPLTTDTPVDIAAMFGGQQMQG